VRVAEETDGCVCDWMCRVGKTFRECRVRALNARIRVINRGECNVVGDRWTFKATIN